MIDKSWIVNVEEDPSTGELLLPLNDEILAQCGFTVGDDIEWVDRGDGSWMIQKAEKQEETEYVLVECMSTYRMRYMVEVPKGKEDWALDTVTMEQAKEFSQLHLGEQIFSHRVITKEEALKLCDKDNSYGSSWTEEVKIKNFFTKQGEMPY